MAQHVSDPDSIGNAVQIDLWCCRHCGNALSAVTNARFAPLHGLLVGPVSHSTTPVPLHKPRARHERAIAKCRSRGLLPSAARRRVVALRLRFARRSSPASAPLCPLADTQTEAQCQDATANSQIASRQFCADKYPAVTICCANACGKFLSHLGTRDVSVSLHVASKSRACARG